MTARPLRPAIPRALLALGLVAVAVLLVLREGGASLAAPPLVPTTTAGPCPDPGGPIVWPLGADGFQPRVLYDGHMQFQNYPAEVAGVEVRPPSVHQGIDIGACPDEYVYAVEPGQVVDFWGEDGDYATVVISSGDDLGLGTFYQHLETVLVGEGDEVQRDQAIGTVRSWSRFTGFDHLHLQRVRAQCYTTSETSCALWKNAIDQANPLPRFAPRMDSDPPTIHDLGAELSLDGPLLFYADGDETTPLDPHGLKGSVDVVACVTEQFRGVPSAECLPDPACDAGFSTAVSPYRMTLCVLRPEPYDAPVEYARTRYSVVYRNVIELEGPAPDVLGVDELPLYYRTDSEGVEAERKPLFVLTHCADAGGSWDASAVLSGTAPAPVELRVELTVEDTSGNVAVAAMAVTVEP